MKKREKKKIKINKIFKESMSGGEFWRKYFAQQTEPNKPKTDNFEWVNEKDVALKKKYLAIPLELWKNILISNNLGNPIGHDYQESSNIILEKDIFRDEKYIGEKKENYNYLMNLFIKNAKENNFLGIKPDFIIEKIPKENFLKIMENLNYIFNYDKNFNSFINSDYINVVGEIKTNSKNIKKGQKKRYIEFCEYMNEKYKSEKIFYITMYIFDNSFKRFWAKDSFKNKPIVYGYIPTFLNDTCIEKQKEIARQFEEEKQLNLRIAMWGNRNSIEQPGEEKYEELFKSDEDKQKWRKMLEESVEKNEKDLYFCENRLNQEISDYNIISTNLNEKMKLLQKLKIEIEREKKIKRDKEEFINFIGSITEEKRKELSSAKEALKKYFNQLTDTRNNCIIKEVTITLRKKKSEENSDEKISSNRGEVVHETINNNNINYLGKKTHYEDDITTDYNLL